eukprot:179170-Amphidinium_carterae.1
MRVRASIGNILITFVVNDGGFDMLRCIGASLLRSSPDRGCALKGAHPSFPRRESVVPSLAMAMTWCDGHHSLEVAPKDVSAPWHHLSEIRQQRALDACPAAPNEWFKIRA